MVRYLKVLIVLSAVAGAAIAGLMLDDQWPLAPAVQLPERKAP